MIRAVLNTILVSVLLFLAGIADAPIMKAERTAL
jgi:hypothetical protein